MGFFDLNIPYEASQSSKPTRIKQVIKAMELGYTGIAYNRTITGVMSDRDRCSITLFSLSSLLNVVPSLTSSVNLHRDLLCIPRSSPFRQYTRLTVCVDSPAQGQALNGGNPILKSYDLVAVRPLNQSAFDHACEKSEVDIIAIDFSEKLPFRLKQPMIKAAMERGVYFEITYSDLILDVQVRRQMIPNAKLLVDWTRGRNLIFSSAAPSANELRGPYDVANLSSLLGLSVERAKAAISKNCRNLIANALRKKHFYKEAIRVEQISSDEKSDSKDPLSVAWLKWDPISSGEGDLQLEDIEKSFAANTRVSNSVKAIDFISVINSMPSHGGNFLTATEAVEVPVATSGVLEEFGGHDVSGTDRNSLCNSPSKIQTFDHGSSQELHFPSDATKTSTNSTDIRAAMNTTEEGPKSSNDLDVVFPFILVQKDDLQSQKHITSCELNTVVPNEDLMGQTTAEIGLTAACTVDTKIESISENANSLSPQIDKSMDSLGSDTVLGLQNVLTNKNIPDIVIKDQEGTSTTENVSGREQLRESGDDMRICVDHVPFLLTSCDMKVKDVSSVANQETLKEVTMEEQEHGDVSLEKPEEVAMEEKEYGHANLDTPEEVAMEEQKYGNSNLETPKEVANEEQEHGDVDAESSLGQDNNLKVNDNSSGANFLPLEEGAMKENKHEEADSESNYPTLVPSLSGKSSAKQRATRQPLLFPLKRLLNPISFKKKSKRVKHKRKA